VGMKRVIKCAGPTVNGNMHKLTKAIWLEIDPEMKKREEYFWGWYCPVCHRIKSKRGG